MAKSTVRKKLHSSAPPKTADKKAVKDTLSSAQLIQRLDEHVAELEEQLDKGEQIVQPNDLKKFQKILDKHSPPSRRR